MLVHYQHARRCVLSDSLPQSFFPCPAFTAGALPLAGCISQAPVPLASVWVWPQRVTGWGHQREGSRKKPSLSSGVPSSGLPPDSIFYQEGPNGSSFLGYPSSQAPGTPALEIQQPQLCLCPSGLWFWLPALGSSWDLPCPVRLLSSSILCATISLNSILSL